MTAIERRRRRWLYTTLFITGLAIGSLICGVYRNAVAQPNPAETGSPPVVLLPSALKALEPPIPRPRSVVVPITGSLPLSPIPIQIPMPVEKQTLAVVAQAPDLLPLPKEEKPAAVTDRLPIENPLPVTKPTPTPTLPPLGIPAPTIEPAPAAVLASIPPPMLSPLPPPASQSEQLVKPMSPAVLPQPDLRLQTGESGNNVKSTGSLPPSITSKFPTQQPAEVVRIAPTVVPPREAVAAIPTSIVTQLRETPMPLSVRRYALSAILGTALVTGTIYADNDPPVNAATKKDVEETNKLLTEIAKDLATLKKDLTVLTTKELPGLKKDLAELKEKDIADIKKDVETLKEFKKQTVVALEGSTDKATGGDGLIKKIVSLDEKLSLLNKQLDSLDKKLTESRTALASPLAKDTEKTKDTKDSKEAKETKEPEKEKPKTGSVKIVNLYETDVDVLVNGKGYRLAPQESKTLTIANGSFTYQLLTAGGTEKTRTIKEGEEVVLKIN